ncbi:hypothetical protein BV898_07681 [Hypsibius exemplaris]|uniref:Uncharacterized protein n=1 Tax=Hypsibius exemplaris TaxID=2072580 RepID=A0A1W0WSX7_HYPEX|nr:hypothetical protein BV898_07681 [Hypsibius exemplaris]
MISVLRSLALAYRKQGRVEVAAILETVVPLPKKEGADLATSHPHNRFHQASVDHVSDSPNFDRGDERTPPNSRRSSMFSSSSSASTGTSLKSKILNAMGLSS